MSFFCVLQYYILLIYGVLEFHKYHHRYANNMPNYLTDVIMHYTFKIIEDKIFTHQREMLECVLEKWIIYIIIIISYKYIKYNTISNICTADGYYCLSRKKHTGLYFKLPT